jgi:CrcB protein
MLKWVLIAIGGAFGSVLRYWFQGWVQRLAGSTFPFGTLAVNVTACFVIGLLGGFFAAHESIREEYRLGLTVGILGGYSTFSTFGIETFKLADNNEHSLAFLNVFVSCAAGLAAVWLGYRIAERWIGA